MRYEPIIREEEVELSPLEKILQTLKENKNILYGIIGAVVIIILLTGVVLILRYRSVRYDTDAWFEFSTVLNKYKDGGILAKGSSRDFIQELEGALEKYPKSSATPYVLYELGNQYYFAEDFEKAKEHYNRIRLEFPAHFLSNPDLNRGSLPRTVRDLVKCDEELKWKKDHPDWLSPQEIGKDSYEGLDNTVSAIVDTNKGFFKIQFYKEKAQKTKENFIRLCENGSYNNCKFFRIIPNVLIMSGDPGEKVEENTSEKEPENSEKNEREEKKSGENLKPQAIDLEIYENLQHHLGTVSMARNPAEEKSSNSIFFICLSSQPTFDNNFTIFGQIVEGISVLVELGQTKVFTDRASEFDKLYQPIDDIYITNIRIEKSSEVEKKEGEEKEGNKKIPEDSGKEKKG